MLADQRRHVMRFVYKQREEEKIVPDRVQEPTGDRRVISIRAGKWCVLPAASGKEQT